MLHILQQRLVLFAQGHPIVAVHIRHVEPVAIPPPDFVEDLVPFLLRHAINNQPGGGNRLPGFVALRRGVVKVVTRALDHEQLGAVVGKHEAANVFRDRRLFAIFESKNFENRRTIAGAAVVESRAGRINQVTGFGRQAAVVVSTHRHAGSPAQDAVKVDRHRCRSFCVRLRFTLRRRRRCRRLVGLRRGRGRRFLRRLLQFLVDVFHRGLGLFAGWHSFWLRRLIGL